MSQWPPEAPESCPRGAREKNSLRRTTRTRIGLVPADVGTEGPAETRAGLPCRVALARVYYSSARGRAKRGRNFAFRAPPIIFEVRGNFIRISMHGHLAST